MSYHRLGILIAAWTVSTAVVSDVHAAPYTFVNVADLNSSAPSGNFTAFGDASISGGQVVFYGEYGGISGIFLGSGGGLTTVAQVGDSTPIGTLYTLDQRPDIANGSAVFAATASGGGFGILSGNGGSLSALVSNGSYAPSSSPNFPSPIFYGGFGTPAVDGNGQAAYVGFFKNDSNVYPFYLYQSRGIFVSDGNGTTKIVELGDTAPTGVFEGNSAFGRPAIDEGTVAFTAGYGLGGGDKGVFLGSGGGLTSVALSGDAAPIGQFHNFSPDVGIDDGYAAFLGYYNNGFTDQGIFRGNGGALTTIVKTGDAAPNGTFTVFDTGNPIAAANGKVGFVGHYAAGGSGIFVGDGGALTSVINVGDALFGSTLNNLMYFGGIDDDGNVAFRYQLSNGQTGFAMAQLAAVPEPGSFALCGVAAAYASWRSRRRRKQQPSQV